MNTDKAAYALSVFLCKEFIADVFYLNFVHKILYMYLFQLS